MAVKKQAWQPCIFWVYLCFSLKGCIFFFQENRDLKLEKNKNKNLAFISFLSKQLKLIKDEVKTWEVKYFFLVFQQIQLGHEV